MLHIIQTRQGFNTALPYLQATDCILLTGDACYSLIDASLWSQLAMYQAQVYALSPDVQARGLKQDVLQPKQLIDFKQFVELTVQEDKSTTWS